VMIGLSFNALVAKQLSPSPDLVTLPFLFLMGATALLVLKLPALFSRWGYRRLFMAGAIFGICGGILSALAIYQSSFMWLCVAGAFIGVYQATAMYYRFAAADSAAADKKSTAIAWVLTGGILAALLGGIICQQSLHLFSQDYLGSFLVSALLAFLALPIMAIAPMAERKALVNSAALKISDVNIFAVQAILFCSLGYLVMAMIMLASPLAMSTCGFHATDAASVIQWHLLGMFAPSLLTGKLVQRFGAQQIALCGIGILLLGCSVAVMNTSLLGFHIALAVVGVGWNFMYMGGSTILTLLPNLDVRAKIQSINEFLTFSLTTLIAGATGWFYAHVGWAWVVLTGALCLLLLLAGLVIKRK
jgi:MFS family permease